MKGTNSFSKPKWKTKNKKTASVKKSGRGNMKAKNRTMIPNWPSTVAARLRGAMKLGKGRRAGVS